MCPTTTAGWSCILKVHQANQNHEVLLRVSGYFCITIAITITLWAGVRTLWEALQKMGTGKASPTGER